MIWMIGSRKMMVIAMIWWVMNDDHEDDNNCEDDGRLPLDNDKVDTQCTSPPPANVKQLQNQHKHRLQQIHSHVIAILTITIVNVITIFFISNYIILVTIICTSPFQSCKTKPSLGKVCIYLSMLFHVFETFKVATCLFRQLPNQTELTFGWDFDGWRSFCHCFWT